jgi:hypothetical protein
MTGGFARNPQPNLCTHVILFVDNVEKPTDNHTMFDTVAMEPALLRA